MGRLSARWRRLWGIRRRRPPIAPTKRPHAGRAEQSIEPQPPFPLTLVSSGQVEEQAAEHAREVVLRVARLAPRPVLHARIVLRVQHDPALERPAIAKATLDVSGRHVRAHVAAEHMLEAIDLLERRLRRNLEDLEELERARRHDTGIVSAGEWRHGDLPTARPEYFPRPPENRELVRRKTFALAAELPEQAALEMQLLDHDFHLFTDVATGDEAVVHRLSDGTIALAEIEPTPDRKPFGILVDPTPAPVLLLDDAIERLNLSGDRFVFFVDAQTRSGNVLYRRYDGHYGLIEPTAFDHTA